VVSAHMRCMMIASLRATAMIADSGASRPLIPE
jgi:hypothetical protein